MANRASSLFNRRAEIPGRTAIVHDGHSISFSQLADDVTLMADYLAGLGVEQGMHVGILLRGAPTFIIVQQALFVLGAVVTPINILYMPGEIRHAVDCCDLAMIVTTGDLGDGLGEMGCPVVLLPSRADSAPDPLDPPPSDRHRPMATVGEGDLAMLLLTSATTGKAKGVMLTAGNFAANYDRTPDWLGLDRDSVILCALPLYNTFGLNQCINAMLVTGCQLVLHSRFDAQHCIAAIAEHRCTFLPAVPTMLQKILDHPAATRETLGSLRTVMTGGAPVPSPLLRRLLEVAPNVDLLTGYGLTEGTALVTLEQVRLGPDRLIIRDRTIGRVLDGMELAIRSESGEMCGTRENGEIVVRGPNVMAGYYRAPEDSAMAIRDGWLHTGDIGYLDEDGYAFIVDRKKDVIIRGGQNIYPADIEEILYQIAGVAEVAVIGLPDELLGEVPVAFVAFGPSRKRPSVDQMLDHCRTSLAGYKLPVAIHVLPELPRGPTGKILRRALKPSPSIAV